MNRIGKVIFFIVSQLFHRFLLNNYFAIGNDGTKSFTTSSIDVNVFSMITALIFSFFESYNAFAACIATAPPKLLP